MLFNKIMLLLIGFGFLACAASAVVYDICLAFQLNRILQRTGHSSEETRPEKTRVPHPSVIRRSVIRWNGAARLTAGKGTARP
jgi:hypothetical protein